VLWHPAARDDLTQLDAIDLAIGDAALAAIDDVAAHRKHGKALGPRHTSGDLTGFFRVKFDLAGRRPERFRLVYEQPDDHTICVWALGERAEQAVYHEAASRVDD